MVEYYDPVQKIEINYYMSPNLKGHLDKVVKKSLGKADKDYVMLVDGYEGSGKSTFAKQCGKYVDKDLNIDRICMTALEFKETIKTAKPNQCVIYDEAVTGLTAGDTIAKVGKMLKSMMMQMRQKNLFVIIILPTVFELNKYAVLARARCLFHIYEKKGHRGYFVGYNRKDLRVLYMKGKKTYSYVRKSRFIGRFYGKDTIDNEAYIKKKTDALEEVDKEDVSENEKHQWLFLAQLHKDGMKHQEIVDYCNENYGWKLNASRVQYALSRLRGKKSPTGFYYLPPLEKGEEVTI